MLYNCCRNKAERRKRGEKMFAIIFDGEIDDSELFDTYDAAEREIEERVCDACREDAQFGCYSEQQEAAYWAMYDIKEI